MNIREFAEHTGLTAHTLRYYERVGLMGQIGREANGHRVYGPQDSQWVTFLHHLRQTGMSIRDMQRYCSLREQGDATLQARLALLERHSDKVAAQLRSQHEHLARLRETVAAYQTRLQRQGPRVAEAAATASPAREVDPAHRR
ncbi:MerR family transcriptional regulator [Piscinibacter sp. XHJ-5]|uniref:MerR family transcriptional regulator n=1 Tax=Piscinibacter sp. XHJ-5 TaxID=3037797 RepID=UPI002452D7C1|nr:MerR family transcriptional regulator [Piscinibacter sp. XHJ-5]